MYIIILQSTDSGGEQSFNKATNHIHFRSKINDEQFGKILGLIDSGKSDGAKLATGGNRHGDKGYYIEPTVFTDVQDGMRIAKEEVGMS